MGTRPTTREAILALIRDEGPMTAADITDRLGMTRGAVGGSINGMRKHGTQFLRITRYHRQIGHAGREAPVYGLGPGKDAKPPNLSGAAGSRERNARYRERYRLALRVRTAARRGRQMNPFSQLIKRKTAE